MLCRINNIKWEEIYKDHLHFFNTNVEIFINIICSDKYNMLNPLFEKLEMEIIIYNYKKSDTTNYLFFFFQVY